MDEKKLPRSQTTKFKAKVKKQTKLHQNTAATVEVKSMEESTVRMKARSPARPKSLFINEIRSMMHGFGDCRCPLLKSAEIIENIVLSQMTELLEQASQNTKLRGGNSIGHEDILFLMRKEKMKLRRLLKYLEVMDIKNLIAKPVQKAEKTQTLTRRVKLCMDFLQEIEVNNQYSNLLDYNVFDPILFERRLRYSENSEAMNTQEYIEYSNARQAAFANNRKGKMVLFRKWLLQYNTTKLEPTKFSFEILNYLAHETVAQIVDLALLVKQDSNPNRLGAVNTTGLYSRKPEGHVEKATSTEGSSSVSSVNPPPPCESTQSTPPEDATPPPPDLPEDSGVWVQISPPVEEVSPPTYSSPAEEEPSMLPIILQERKKKKPTKYIGEYSPYNPITPSELEEVMRRYSQPIGLFHLFSEVFHEKKRKNLLCC